MSDSRKPRMICMSSSPLMQQLDEHIPQGIVSIYLCMGLATAEVTHMDVILPQPDERKSA